MMKSNRLSLGLVLLAGLLLGLGGCDKKPPATGTGSTSGGSGAKGSGAGGKPKVGFIVNVVNPFWNHAKVGTQDAAAKFGIECEFYAPPTGSPEEQKRKIEDMMSSGLQGLAISPVDPKNQTEILNAVAAKMPLICHDSDAPDSKRIFYLGTSNYKGGLEAGRLVKEVLPNGGKIMIFVGKMDMLNSQERDRGVRDELKDPKYQIIATRTDNGDEARAKQNAEDALSKYPDLDCMVGLWAYNAPMCLKALEGAGKVGKVKIISFDHMEQALEGIQAGHIHATVAQQPYEFGYKSVEFLSRLLKGEKPADMGIPADMKLDVETVVVKKANVEEFRKKMRELDAKLK